MALYELSGISPLSLKKSFTKEDALDSESLYGGNAANPTQLALPPFGCVSYIQILSRFRDSLIVFPCILAKGYHGQDDG
jgi:hypothetical protein